MRFSLVTLSAIVILAGITMSQAGFGSAQSPNLSGNVFYFHYRSVIYNSGNNSVIILQEANLTAPVNSTPKIIEVSAAIRNATTAFGSIWIGSAAWVTPPASEAETLQGTLTFSVWLSSDDPAPSFSGIGAGVAVLDENYQTAGNYVYTFSYAQGKILSSTPAQYDFTVALDRQVFAGQRLVFAVGVGSTTEAWGMKILFDDPQHASRVQLPSSITVVPEFPTTITVLVSFAAMVTAMFLKNKNAQPERRKRKSPPLWAD